MAINEFSSCHCTSSLLLNVVVVIEVRNPRKAGMPDRMGLVLGTTSMPLVADNPVVTVEPRGFDNCWTYWKLKELFHSDVREHGFKPLESRRVRRHPP